MARRGASGCLASMGRHRARFGDRLDMDAARPSLDKSPGGLPGAGGACFLCSPFPRSPLARVLELPRLSPTEPLPFKM